MKKPVLLLGCTLVFAFVWLISTKHSRRATELIPPTVQLVNHSPNPAPKRPTAAPAADRASTASVYTTNRSAIVLSNTVLAAFQDWTEAYLKASTAERAAMRANGVALAEARRPVFKQLIEENPRQAVEQAVPMRVRQELPDEIVALLEERVSGRAALRVYQGVGPDNHSRAPTIRMAQFENGNTYEAHVYGRREESVLSLANISLNAIVVDQHAALPEDPIRTLEIGERPDRRKPAAFVCPVSGKKALAEEDWGEPITEETPAIEAFGEIVYLCDGSHAIIYRDQLIYAEGGTGGPIPFTGILPAAPTPSIGNVKVLVIPMTFADQNDVPSSESVLYQLMRDVGDHYAKASYGKLTLLTTVTPPIKLPHNEAWYIQKDTSNGGTIDGLGLEHSHARAEARKLGFDDDEFDCVVVRLRGGPRAVGGYGGGRSVWIYGDGVDLSAHEIGHSFGLAHNNFWNTSGASAIGVGANEEYGGHWDVMGGIGLPYGHYNAAGKNQIRWLPDPFVTEITSSGLYRIHAQDQAILDPSKRFALKIRKDNIRTYWGELRGLFTGHATRTWADYGMILGWRYPGGGGNNLQLIDTTPGSPFGKDDSPISLGRTFSDTEAGIHLTTIAVNPATADEPKSVDVVVNIGRFDSNHPPTLALTASATVVPLNVPVIFTADATDPDGDLLAYSWQHFGDSTYRTISPNAPVLTRAFAAAGTYVVSCTVSDMKGGTSIRNVLITVGNGGGRFTMRGRVTLGGQGLAGVIVNANSANGVVTDTEGYYTIPNLTAATYAMTPLLYGYTFTELFNNSVSVGPSFSGADFEASPVSRLTITASIPACNEPSAGAPAQFTLTRTGDASQALTVNVLGPIGTATRTSDYVITPAPATGSQGFSTLTIPAGSDSLVVSITPVNDTSAEGPETVALEMGPGNGYLIDGAARATVVINDDDTTLPKVSLALAEPKTIEGTAAPASIRFTRSGATTGALAVAYTIAGTAVSGADFIPLGGSITIPAGAPSATLDITGVDDSTSEPLETVVIRIANSVTSLADPTANSATAAIVDDDVQVLTVRATDAAATERDLNAPGAVADTATFLVTRAGDISQALTIYYAVAGTNSGTIATALHGIDYEALPGVLLIPAGQTSGSITIVPRWDGIGEGPESVTLQLGAGPTNYRLGTPNAATITITDAGDPAYVEVLGVDNAVEGGTTGRFRFSLKGSAAGNVVVNYTVSGTATSGSDFNALSGSVTIPGNGVNTTEVVVTPINDVIAEDLETITVTITPGPAYQVFPATGSATIWMRDNEQPTLFVDAHSTAYPPAFAETSTGSSFYISRLGSSASATTVSYVMSGSAANGVDYQLLSGTATIAAGASGVDVTVTPLNDATAEGTETITLTLAPGAYGRGPAATFYLTDDENPATSISFGAASSSALESTGTVTIPVVLSPAAAAPVTVEYLVETGGRASVAVNGSAASPLPYWVRSDWLNNDVVGSISEDGSNWTAVSTQTMTISSAAYMAGLYVCSFNAGVLCTSVFDNVVVTNLQPGATVGARAGANIGSTTLAGSANVAGGVYTVSGAGDNVEGTTDQGYFTWFPINNSTSCTIIARVVSQQNTANGATAGVMIRENTANNARRGYMAATPGAGFEFHYRIVAGGAEAKVTSVAAAPLWVRLQRSGNVISSFQSNDGSVWTPISTNLTFAFGPELLAGLAVSAQAEGSLATATIDNVSFTPGPLPTLLGRTVGFTAIQGTDVVEDEVYTVSASGDGINGTQDDCYFVCAPVTGDFTLTARVAALESTGGTPQAGVMLRENTRRSSRMVFVGGRPGLAPQMVWRATTLTTGNGLGIDYTLAPGILNIPAGTTTGNISFPIVNDSIPEPDEPVTIILRNANGARLGGTVQHTLVIVDDDSGPALPLVGFAASASAGSESNVLSSVAVTLSVPPQEPVSIDYQISPGTATDTDFIAASGTLNFAAGDTVGLIPLSLLDDALVEAGETIFVTLSNPVGLNFNTLTNHTFTIVDDDAAIVRISSTDTNASETGDTALLELTRTGSTASALTVNLNRTGTATAGSDYGGINGTATIPLGEASIILTLEPVQDGSAEGTETAVVTLLAGAGYTVGAPGAVTAFIADDDRNTVAITAADEPAVEGGSSGTLTVTRSGNTNTSLTVTLSLSGTATSGSDYTTTPASVTSIAFAPGQNARSVAINPIDDPITEGDEAVLVQISAGSYDIGGAGYASVVIRDNDIPPTVFISSPGAQGVVIAVANGVLFEATADDDGAPLPLSYAWSQVSGPGTVTFGSPSNSATAATFSAPGVYLVRVTVTDGQFTASDQIAVNLGVTNILFASDWISSDIGPATLRGFSGRSGSNWVLSATGIGFATSSDRAHAVTRTVSGDGAIVARITAVSGPTGSEAGVSVRDSLHRYARRAAMLYQPASRTLRFRSRLVANTTDFSLSVPNLDLPLWLKLERTTNNTVSAFYATDIAGEAGPWVPVSTNVNITMDVGADYSLTADSGSDTVPAAVVFDHVALTPEAIGPTMLAEDFGAGTQTGTYSYAFGNDVHTLTGQGSIDSSGMFWGEQFTGDFVLTAFHTDATSSANDARSGIMVRDSMDDGAMAFLGRNPQGAFSSFVWRTNPKGGTSGLNGITQRQRWLRLIRRGNQITALHAPNNGGVPGAWVQLGTPQTVFLQPTIIAGLYCNNGSGVGFNTATFSRFSVVPLHNAPVVNAGTATNIVSPLAVTGTVADDGLPSPLTTEWTVAAAPGPGSFANSNALATSFTFSAPGDYTLRLWADDGIARSFDDLSFTYSAGGGGFPEWQAANFAGGATNPDAAPEADPDGDGFNNAGEYACGTNPNAAGAHPIVPSIVTNGPNEFLSVTITRDPAATDATIAVEASAEVAPVTWSAAGLIVEADTPTLLRVRDNVPLTSAPRRFLRVRVTLH